MHLITSANPPIDAWKCINSTETIMQVVYIPHHRKRQIISQVATCNTTQWQVRSRHVQVDRPLSQSGRRKRLKKKNDKEMGDVHTAKRGNTQKDLCKKKKELEQWSRNAPLYNEPNGTFTLHWEDESLVHLPLQKGRKESTNPVQHPTDCLYFSFTMT